MILIERGTRFRGPIPEQRLGDVHVLCYETWTSMFSDPLASSYRRPVKVEGFPCPTCGEKCLKIQQWLYDAARVSIEIRVGDTIDSESFLTPHSCKSGKEIRES